MSLDHVLGQFLVGISITSTDIRNPTQKNHSIISGSIIQIGSEIGILTAGHVLEGLFEEIENNLYKIESYILDIFGPIVMTKMGIPINLEECSYEYINNDDPKLDFGIIYLNSFQVDMLKKHDVNCIQETCLFPYNNENSKFYMIGFPQEIADGRVSREGFSNVSWCYVELTNVCLDPEESELIRLMANYGDDFPIRSLNGFSGSPIIAINKEDTRKRQVIAMQTSYEAASRRIYACPVELIYEMYRRDLFTRAD